jgi:hypothetical protein
MTSPKISGLSIRQEPFSLRWRARGHVDGVGWLEAWGPSLIEAMEALQALAPQQVVEQGEDTTPR